MEAGQPEYDFFLFVKVVIADFRSGFSIDITE